MNVLISAASRHGATWEIAEAIGEALAAAGLASTVLPPEQVDDISEYDAVVLGSGVYAGRWLEPARELVDRAAPDLAARPVWLFSSGPIGDPPKPVGDPADAGPIVERTGAREHKVFAGRLVKGELGLAERAIIAVVKAPEGDFRDWADIRTWAAGIAATLATELAAPPPRLEPVPG
jgi:menaquinone-dependent protoporphyrinogen oxidase